MQQPGCLKCELSIRADLQQAYAIRSAIHLPEWDRAFIRTATSSGLWRAESLNEPLVTMTYYESEATGLVVTIGDGFGDPETPFRTTENSDRSMATPLSRFRFVDAPISTSAFTLRRFCRFCGQRWSLVTINRRLLWLSSFLAAHYTADPGPIRPLLAKLERTDPESINPTSQEDRHCSNDMVQLTGAVFVLCHETTHIEGPYRARAAGQDPTAFPAEDIELMCDGGACIMIFQAISNWFGPMTYARALEIGISIASILVSSRLLLQHRVGQMKLPAEDGYPSYDERLGFVVRQWKAWVSALGYEEEAALGEKSMLDHLVGMCLKLKKENDQCATNMKR